MSFFQQINFIITLVLSLMSLQENFYEIKNWSKLLFISQNNGQLGIMCIVFQKLHFQTIINLKGRRAKMNILLTKCKSTWVMYGTSALLSNFCKILYSRKVKL